MEELKETWREEFAEGMIVLLENTEQKKEVFKPLSIEWFHAVVREILQSHHTSWMVIIMTNDPIVLWNEYDFETDLLNILFIFKRCKSNDDPQSWTALPVSQDDFTLMPVSDFLNNGQP